MGHLLRREHLSCSGWVENQIRRDIFSGKLKFGDPLNETHLAKRYAYSQTTIRDALSAIQLDGLVVRHPGRGAQVVNFSRQEVLNRLEVRKVVERFSFDQASKNISEPSLLELRTLADRVGKEAAGEYDNVLGEADRDFHLHVCTISENHSLSEILRLLTTPLFALLGVYWSMPGREPKPAERAAEHHELVDGLAGIMKPNVSGLQQLVDEHIVKCFGWFAENSYYVDARTVADEAELQKKKSAADYEEGNLAFAAVRRS